MNGTSRLYRSTSEAMLGGVAAGLGNYFKVDPTIFRAAFVILTFLSGGGFILVYLAMWLLIPTAGSTAAQPGQVVQENLNDMGARIRSFAGGSGTPTTNISNSQPGAPVNGNPNGGNGGNGGNGSNVGNGAPYQMNMTQRQGIGPIFLIGLGIFFLLANFGFWRVIHWGAWWPILLIGLGVLMLSRRVR